MIPARLYHGTSARHLGRILRQGLLPRARQHAGAKRRGNWGHTVASNPSAVYLTDAYPLHFAVAATQGDEQGLVLEIDTAKLDPAAFRPDEDFLEQVTRGRDQLPAQWTLQQRTRHYREHADEFAPGPSLAHLGTVAYGGVIAPPAIARLVLLDQGVMVDLVRWGFDPQIALLNYRILGEFYRRGTRWLFGEDVPATDEFGGPRPWPDRSGITVTVPASLAVVAGDEGGAR